MPSTPGGLRRSASATTLREGSWRLSRPSDGRKIIIVAVEYLRNVPHAASWTGGGKFKSLLTSPRPLHSSNTPKTAQIYCPPAGRFYEGREVSLLSISPSSNSFPLSLCSYPSPIFFSVLIFHFPCVSEFLLLFFLVRVMNFPHYFQITALLFSSETHSYSKFCVPFFTAKETVLSLLSSEG